MIADSGVFSTALSEAADPRYVGTALTAQTAIGFALTVVSIQLVPVLAEMQGQRHPPHERCQFDIGRCRVDGIAAEDDEARDLPGPNGFRQITE